MSASDASVAAARAGAADAAARALSPLLASYNAGVDDVLKSQTTLQGSLSALLEGAGRVWMQFLGTGRTLSLPPPPHPSSPHPDVRSAHAQHAAGPGSSLGVQARRIEALRKRLDNVGSTMSRVQLRLDSLTAVVTKTEDRKRKERQLAPQ